MITDLDGEELIFGSGGEPLVASYDLCEKNWKLLWSEDALSITGLKGVIDIQKKTDNQYVLIEGSYSFEDRYRFYLIGHSKVYSKIDCYRGRHKFLEGKFELFERPLFAKKFEVGSVDSLLERIKEGLI